MKPVTDFRILVAEQVRSGEPLASRYARELPGPRDVPGRWPPPSSRTTLRRNWRSKSARIETASLPRNACLVPIDWGETRRGLVAVGIAVRPAIDGDRFDVARWVETAGCEDACQLVADLALELLEGGAQQIVAAGFELFRSGYFQVLRTDRSRSPRASRRLHRRARICTLASGEYQTAVDEFVQANVGNA